MALSDQERSFAESARAQGYSDDEVVAEIKRRRAASTPAPPVGTAHPADASTGEDYGRFDAVAREAGNIFGFGPAIQAGLETVARKTADVVGNAGHAVAHRIAPGLVSDVSPNLGTERLGNAGYDERRALYAHALDVGRAAHPLATGLTSGARGVAEGAAALAVPGVAAASPLAAGATFGGLEGAGEGISHGDTLPEAAARTAKGVAGGALGGYVGGKIINKIVTGSSGIAEDLGRLVGKTPESAAARLRKQVGNDIVGDVRGASTATARKQMADDIKDIQDVVVADPRLESDLHDARALAPTKIGKAIDTTDAKLATWREERPKLYKQMSEVLPGGGIRSGDYRQTLLDAADELESVPSGHNAQVADQLRKHVDRIEHASKFGGNTPVFDPTVKIDGQPAGELVDMLTKARNAAQTDAQRAAYDAHIADIQAAASKRGYNPDAIVSPDLLRDDVTDLQSTAYDAYGGINGTNSYQKARETASYAEKFWRGVKDDVAKAHPELIADINQHDKNVSALLHIKDVLSQRFNRATVGELGGTEGSKVAELAHKAAKFKGHPVSGAIGLAGKAAARADYAMNKAVRGGVGRESDLAFTGEVLKHLRSGLPLSAAINAAQSATQDTSE